jgi:hypothetical protein
VTPDLAAVVKDFFEKPDEQSAACAPGLAERLGGADELNRFRQDLVQRIGAPVTMATLAHEVSLRGPRGRVAVWAETDAQNRLSGLITAPPGAMASTRRTRVTRNVLLGNGVFLIVVGATAVSGWTSDSALGAVGNGTQLLLFGLLFERLMPWWLFSRTVRMLFRAVLLVGIASLARLPHLPQGSWKDTLVPGALLLVALAVLVRARWKPVGPRVSRSLTFPLAEGRWVIGQGGRRPLNHHRRVAEQAGALDLLRLGDDGARAAGVFPRELSRFAAYGTPVLAPCDGMVLIARDGLPDQDPEHPQVAPAAGNHVRIDTGFEQILLAHLQPGTVAVTAGEQVHRGQAIGLVGNSGNSSEPHLHLHAERDGIGLQLRFDHIRRPLARSKIINAAGRIRRDASGPASGERTTDPQ